MHVPAIYKGSTVYLVSEPNTEGRKSDAIVNGLKFEFKIKGHESLIYLNVADLKARR